MESRQPEVVCKLASRGMTLDRTFQFLLFNKTFHRVTCRINMKQAPWIGFTLKLAAIYNIIWGAWVVLFPNQFFEWTRMPPLAYPSIWQGVGMIVGVYGIGYWCASYDAMRHWPIVLVGFLGKLLGPLGFVFNYLVLKEIPFEFSYTIYTNDLIWWIPFFLILKQVHENTGWKLTD